MVLYDNNIGNAGTMVVARALRTNTTIKSVNLVRNKIRDPGGMALSEMLQYNTTIESLNLQFNKISPPVRKAIEKTWVQSGRAAWKLLFNEKQLSAKEIARLQRAP